MNLIRLYHTVKYLRPTQIWFQGIQKFKKKVSVKPTFSHYKEGKNLALTEFIPKSECCKGNTFFFLNQENDFCGSWTPCETGDLWTYNLNYMDYLLQSSMSVERARQWILNFIENLPQNKKGLEPYPITLRGINWIKFISQHPKTFNAEERKRIDTSLYSQYTILSSNTEKHLLGNHYLENGYSLLWAAVYFQDKTFYNQASSILKQELDEEILSDGGHFELSPMYHCILLDRLLDCINLLENNMVFKEQQKLKRFLLTKAQKMLSWLDAIVYQDKTIPLLNDAAYHIAPTYEEIVHYAKRLSIDWEPGKLGECGYRKHVNTTYECIVDVGKIGADYIPGHAHADTFNFELRIHNRPFIVDTGISTYNKNERRQYERSTAAHNTVTLLDKDSSEVWGGFRCAKRANVKITADNSGNIEAVHDGYKESEISRSFHFSEKKVMISDQLSHPTPATGRLHFHQDVQIHSIEQNKVTTSLGTIEIKNCDHIFMQVCEISQEYNILHPSECIHYQFSTHAEIEININ